MLSIKLAMFFVNESEDLLVSDPFDDGWSNIVFIIALETIKEFKVP